MTMTDYTANEVLAAIADAFPSEERLYEEFYDEIQNQENVDYKALAKRYLEQEEYLSPEDLIDWSELAYDCTPGNYSYKDRFVNIRGDNVQIKCVQQLGGMDEGTTADVTFQVGDQFFTKRGWYQSHYGYEYDGEFEETVRKEVIAYNYERKN